jgi:hypothetical protein
MLPVVGDTLRLAMIAVEVAPHERADGDTGA